MAARNEQNLLQVGKEIQDAGGSALAVKTDITSADQCNYLISQAISNFGSLDILILNAGISMWAPFEKIKDVSFFQDLINTNYLGAVNCVHSGLPHLKENNGMIVATTTAQALIGFPHHSGYSASKHALHGFLDTLDIELQGTVHFLNIFLGWVRETNLRQNAFNAGGEQPEKSDRNHTSQSVGLDDCTEVIIEAIKKGKKNVFIPWKLRLIPFLNLFFRGFLRRKIFKAVREQTAD